MQRVKISEESSKKLYTHVYKPADDTYLLIDSLEKDLEFIKSQVKPEVFLEIGGGSGIVINTLANTFGVNNNEKYFATDVNPHAIELILENAKYNKIEGVNVIKTDLVEAVKDMLKNKVDVLVSNPPFEPSPQDEVGDPSVKISWCVGPTGRAIIDRILPELPDLVSQKGVIYMMMIKDNGIDDIINIMKSYGFYHKVILEKNGNTSSFYNRIYYQYCIRFSKTDYD